MVKTYTIHAYNDLNKTKKITKKIDCNSFESAELYLMINYPKYYFGATIICGGEFMENPKTADFVCIPTAEYYKEEYNETNLRTILNEYLLPKLIKKIKI